MRLICPNCGAQYEVDDKVIPDDGRDVQCSNCGHTWFQRPAHFDQDLADELNQELSEEPQAPGPDGKPVPQRRGLDPQIAGVLQEEAAHEAAVRRGDKSGLETQPDLGLDDTSERAASRSAAARSRMAKMRGVDEGSPEAIAAALAAASASRRDLLPDIEEINSSLRASNEHQNADADQTLGGPTKQSTKPKGKGGFRRGFILMIALAAILVVVYLYAPDIARAVPQTEPYLAAYVDFANTFSVRVDELISTIKNKVLGLIASVTGG